MRCAGCGESDTDHADDVTLCPEYPSNMPEDDGWGDYPEYIEHG